MERHSIPMDWKNIVKISILHKAICRFNATSIEITMGTSLVAQWLRIRLPMQGTQVRSLVWEDPICRGATKPVHHYYWACALEPMCHNYWSPHTLSPCSATREATAMRSPHTATKSSPCSLQLEKARAHQQRPNTAKNSNGIFHKTTTNDLKICTEPQKTPK